MNKRTLLLTSCMLCLAPAARPSLFDEVFQESERMMRRMNQHFALMEKGARGRHQDGSQHQDYTLQHYQRDGVHGVLIEFSQRFASQAPVVNINTSKDVRGVAVKELEVVATAQQSKDAPQGNEAAANTYTCYTHSSVTTVRDGVVTQQVQESSEGSLKDGVLSIKHQLPRDVNEEDYTMSFNDRQLRIEFKLREPERRENKRALKYTASTKDATSPVKAPSR